MGGNKDVLETLRRQFPHCCATRLPPRSGCKLNLRALKGVPHLTLDFDKCQTYPNGVQRPDFLLIVQRSRLCAALIEMKSGQLRARGVDQLQSGAGFLEQILDELSLESDFDFRPVLVQGRCPSIEIRILNKRKVAFRGRDYEVTPLKSGSGIERIFS